jgi:hypothetical protein
MLDEMLNVQAISEFGCDKKLVGQTYDGASVMEGHVTGVQTKLLTSHPNVLFTQLCTFHRLSSAAQLSNNLGDQKFVQNFECFVNIFF